MKFLLLLLISFSAMASYLPESKIGQDTTGMKIYSKRSKCESVYSEKCFSIRKTGNHSYNEIESERNLKEQSESCSDESDCIAKMSSLECLSDGFSAIRTAENDEVYCTKYQAERIIENSVKKAQHDLDKQGEKDAKQAKKDAVILIKAKKWKQFSDKEKDDLIDYLMENIN